MNMVQVNLLSKKKGAKNKRNISVFLGLGLFGAFSIFFLVQVIALVVRFVSVNQKLKAVSEETATISDQMLRDNERLNQFILTKFILGKILDLRNSQFDYSAYLAQVQELIPIGTDISGVDFQTKGFVDIKTLSSNSSQMSILEKALRSSDLSATDFESIVITSVDRSVLSEYRTGLLFGIKKNNGNK